MKQLGRAWRLGHDLARVPAAIGRSLAWAVHPHAERPCLAVLEGEPLARAGATSAYRIRVHNPTAIRRTLEVSVVGWVDSRPDGPFRLVWTAVLEAGAVAERWLGTEWRGRAAWLDHAPDGSPIMSANDVMDRWHVEASAATDVLRVSGALVR